jgi:PAS domain S-box-containing protein
MAADAARRRGAQMTIARAASLRWRVPLLILLVLAVVQGAFLWTAYRQTTRALLAAATAQLEGAGGQLAGLLTQSVTARLAEARRLANMPAIRRFAATGDGSAEAVQALREFGVKNPQSTVVLDARGPGDALRLSEGNVTILRVPAASSEAALPAEGVAPLRAEGDQVFFKVTAAVPAEAGTPAAAISVERRLSSSGADPIEELLGRKAVLRLGNAGHDLWTDLAQPAPGPPLPAGESYLRYVHDGDPRIGVASDVAGTPWRTWVEFSERSLLEPAGMLIRRMVPATILLTLLAVLAVAAVTRGVIGPLEEMAGAAEKVAHGDFQQRVAVQRRDEIGQLAAAFNIMAARIATSRSELESRVSARTAELEAARLELDRFFSTSIDLLCIAGTDGTFRRVNPAWTETLGWSAKELTSVPFVHFVHPADVEATHTEALALRAGGSTVSFENRYRAKDGSWRWLSWKASAMPDAGLIFAAARDITDRKRTEEELQQRAIELTALNQELEAFSYSVSHDLRAPLRSIDGFSQALAEDFSGALPAEGLDYLQRIRNAAQHMGRLIDDLLKLARVTRTELSVTAVDLSAIAGEVAGRLAGSEPDRRVDWRIQPGLVVRGDAQLLQIVLENLLSNAWKFTSRTTAAVIEVTSVEGHGQLAYAVRDNGAGFDMAHATKLFGAFQRLHSAREFPGTGVGLATVQRIVHKHGGTVWAEAAPGAGATFAFTLGR